MEAEVPGKSLSEAECFISVDIETSGPVPEAFSLLSIGACVVDDPESLNVSDKHSSAFYCTVKPLSTAGSDPAALRVTGLSLDHLAKTGQEPADAMLSFEGWIKETAGESAPVFVGLNASFDWSFINYYFHRFLGRNPFGFSALDIKSMYLGATGCSWAETRSSRMAETLGISHGRMAHQALDDARAQAVLFNAIRHSLKKQIT